MQTASIRGLIELSSATRTPKLFGFGSYKALRLENVYHDKRIISLFRRTFNIWVCGRNAIIMVRELTLRTSASTTADGTHHGNYVWGDTHAYGTDKGRGTSVP